MHSGQAAMSTEWFESELQSSALMGDALVRAMSLIPNAAAFANRIFILCGRADIAFGEDGSIGLLWTDDRTYYIDVDFIVDGRVHYYIRAGENFIEERVLPNIGFIGDIFRALPFTLQQEILTTSSLQFTQNSLQVNVSVPIPKASYMISATTSEPSIYLRVAA